MSETSHTHTDDIIVDADEFFTINTTTRVISSGSNKKLTIMQYDHKSERYSFEIDREIDKHDLTKCNRVQVHFNNIGSNRLKQEGIYTVDDVQVKESDDKKVTFTWLIGSESTKYSGALQFLISFECVDGDKILYRWSTSICNLIQVTTGMDNNDEVFEIYSDDLLKWQNEMEVEYIPYMVDKCYVEREFATSEEVAVIFSITEPVDTPVVVIAYTEATDETIDNLFNNEQGG